MNPSGRISSVWNALSPILFLISSARYAFSPAFAFAFPSINCIASAAGGSSLCVVDEGLLVVVTCDVGCVTVEPPLPTVIVPLTPASLLESYTDCPLPV